MSFTFSSQLSFFCVAHLTIVQRKMKKMATSPTNFMQSAKRCMIKQKSPNHKGRATEAVERASKKRCFQTENDQRTDPFEFNRIFNVLAEDKEPFPSIDWPTLEECKVEAESPTMCTWSKRSSLNESSKLAVTFPPAPAHIPRLLVTPRSFPSSESDHHIAGDKETTATGPYDRKRRSLP
jgi:hypothetical protein